MFCPLLPPAYNITLRRCHALAPNQPFKLLKYQAHLSAHFVYVKLLCFLNHYEHATKHSEMYTVDNPL